MIRQPRLALRTLLLAIATAGPAGAQGVPNAGTATARSDSLVVSTEWLAAHLRDPRVVIVEVTMDDKPRAALIPGARRLPYARLAVTRDGISTELPAVDSLRRLVESLGINNDSHVVVYAHEAPMATRLLMTLDYLGHSRLSLLDGGLTKWQAERRPTSATEPAVAAGAFTPNPRAEAVVTADWINARLGKTGLALIDTRTDGEYNGTGNRSGMPSAGHLPGARQLEWQSLFVSSNGEAGLELKPRAELRRLFEERVASGDTVVTYCWVGYRASATYFAARLLGYETKFYDGSYQDWQKRKLPTKAGTTP